MAEIRRIAKVALEDKIIDRRSYDIVQYRFPFPSYDHRSVEEVARLFDISPTRVRELEHKVYRLLLRHSREKAVEELIRNGSLRRKDLLKLEIKYLQWGKNKMNRRALRALLSELGLEATVEDVITLFDDAARSVRGTLKLINYGKGLGHITYEIFSEVGIELPQVKIK